MKATTAWENLDARTEYDSRVDTSRTGGGGNNCALRSADVAKFSKLLYIGDEFPRRPTSVFVPGLHASARIERSADVSNSGAMSGTQLEGRQRQVVNGSEGFSRYLRMR